MESKTIKQDKANLIGFLIKEITKISRHIPKIKKHFMSVAVDWSWPSINVKFYNKAVKVTPVFICYSQFSKIISEYIKKRFFSKK